MKHYNNAPFTEFEKEIYLEDSIDIFLTVRSYTVARLVNKRTQKIKGHKEIF